MQTQIIISQILILSFIVIVGILALRFKIVGKEIKDNLASIIFNITLPLLLFTTISEMDFDGDLFKNGLLVFLFTFLGIAMLYLMGFLASRAFKLEGNVRSIHIAHTMFGNIVFLGFPLFDALFPGGTGLFYAAVYQLAQGLVLWSVGILIINNQKTTGIKAFLFQFLNPNSMAFFLGLIAMIFGIKLPGIIEKAFSGLGKTTIYLSMLYIGAVLAQTKVKELFRYRNAYVLSLNKMILVPVMLTLLVAFFQHFFTFDFKFEARAVLIMQTAMPCMATIVVLAKQYNSDDQQATNNLFLSTLLSILSLPFVFWFLQLF